MKQSKLMHCDNFFLSDYVNYMRDTVKIAIFKGGVDL